MTVKLEKDGRIVVKENNKKKWYVQYKGRFGSYCFVQ